MFNKKREQQPTVEGLPSIASLEKLVPNIDADPRLVEINRRLEELRTQKRKIEQLLHDGVADFEPGDVRPRLPSIEADVQTILDGGDIDALGDRSPARHRESLLRQFHALEQVIPILGKKRRELWVECMQTACGTLEQNGFAQAIQARILANFVEQQTILSYFENVCNLLEKLGLSAPYRPRSLQLLPYEYSILHGDSNGRPALQWWIIQRQPAPEKE